MKKVIKPGEKLRLRNPLEISLESIKISGIKIDLDSDGIPIKIQGSFKEDLNIDNVNLVMLKKLHMEYKRIPILKDRLSILLKENDKNITVNLRRTSSKKSQTLVNKIEKLEKCNLIEKYTNSVKDYLEQYRNLGPYVKKIDKNGNILTSNFKRIEIIELYLECCKDYIDIDIYIEPRSNTDCNICGTSMVDLLPSDNGAYYCPTCGFEKITSINSKQLIDIKNVSTRNDYEDRENFWKSLQKYQGKQQDKTPDKLYSDLDMYFQKSHKLPPSEMVKKLPLNKEGYRHGTSRLLMLTALKELGYSHYYEDINLIMHKLWNWPLPDVSHLEDTIMSDYDKTQEVFRKLPNKTRLSSLNTQYRLFKHLQLRGHSCKAEDFKIITSRNSLEEHEEIWRKCIEGCNDPDLYVINMI